MTRTAWAPQFCWQKVTRRITSSWASIPSIYHFSFNSRKRLPAERLLPWLPHLPSCSYSEILQLQLPYLVAGTVLCLVEPPRPRRPQLGRGPAPAGHPARAPGEQRSSGRGHAHVRSTFPGLGRGGAARAGAGRAEPHAAAGQLPLLSPFGPLLQLYL